MCVGSNELHEQDSVKYVGVDIDKHLCWGPHISSQAKVFCQPSCDKKSRGLPSLSHKENSLSNHCSLSSGLLCSVMAQLWSNSGH